MAKMEFSGEDKASAKVDQIQHSYLGPEADASCVGTQHQVIHFDAERLRHQKSPMVDPCISNSEINWSSSIEKCSEGECMYLKSKEFEGIQSDKKELWEFHPV